MCATAQAPPCVALKRVQGRSTKLVAEAQALSFLNHRDFPHVPTLLAQARDHLVVSWLGQDTLTLDAWYPTATAPERAALGRALGQWIAGLHCLHVPPCGVKLSDDPMPWHARLSKHIGRARGRVQRAHVRGLLNQEEAQVALDAAQRLERWASAARWPTRPRAMIHRDLRPPNILADATTRAFVGVVDFERAAAGDPAWDFAKLHWWCLMPYPDLREPFERAYGALKGLPDANDVAHYKAFEALGMVAYFAGRAQDYPAFALVQLRAWVESQEDDPTSAP